MCKGHFGQGRPCLGCPEAERDALAAGPEFLVSQTPVPRKISAACQKVLGEGARDASINQVSDLSICIRTKNVKVDTRIRGKFAKLD